MRALTEAGPGPRAWAGLVALAAVVQLALVAWATGPGLAGTSDSGYYLHAAGTLRATGQLLNSDGTAYRYWPPLYPALLALSGSLAGVRVLQGTCLLGSLLLWSWLGRLLLPGRRAAVLPALLALSTPWLLVSKFVWAESGFLLLFATYAVLLSGWLRTGSWRWWGAATAVGFLLPLQRTLGLFLLAGVGAGLLLGEWRRLPPRHRGQLALHLVVSAAGGLVWQWYALLLAGPSRYHPGQGWAKLLSAGADYGFVLGRWLLPLPTAGRGLLPHVMWLGALLVLFGLLWPRRRRGPGQEPVAATPAGTKNADDELPAAKAGALLPGASLRAVTSVLPRHSLGGDEGGTVLPSTRGHQLLRALWSTALVLVLLVAALAVFGQSAAGIQEAERYASVLFAPVVLLALAAWPARVPRWLGQAVVAVWLLSAAVRAVHVATDLRQRPPLATGLGTGPVPHGQQVGAAGQ